MARSIEEVFAKQSAKLDKLTMATTFIQNKSNMASELIAAQVEMSSLQKTVDVARMDLEIMRNKNNSIKNLSRLLERLMQEVRHMENNIPPKLLHDYASMQNESKESLSEKNNMRYTSNTYLSDDVADDNKEYSIQNCQKMLFNEPEIYPRINLLSQDEFEGIPKYMLGRQSLNAINQFISTINGILKAKYSLLALGRNGARKKGEYDLYMTYKKQESTDREDKDKVHFFTSEDYQRSTKTKLSKSTLNLLTILRHFKRIREIRTAKHVQYTVVAS